MLDGTYDIGGYNFFMIYLNKKDYPLYIDKYINENPDNCSIIEFNNIDGLNAAKIMSLTPTGRYYIVCAIKLGKNYHTIDEMCVHSEYLEKNQQFQEIDKLYMNHLINSLGDRNVPDPKKLKILKCFMERYMCRTKEEVDEKLKKLNLHVPPLIPLI